MIPIRIFILLFFVANSALFYGQTPSIPYFKSKGIVKSTTIKQSKKYKQIDLLIDVTDPNTQQSLTVLVHYFQNTKAGKLPFLLIVPPINGISIREKKVSKHFLREGYHTLVIEPIKNISDKSIPLNAFEDNLLSFVGAVRSCIDVIVEQPEIDSNNLFIWASSMGAIYSSIVIGVDHRINAGIFIVGGADIPEIVTKSEQRHIVSYRKERMNQEGLIDTAAFHQKIDSLLLIDPLKMKPLLDAHSFYCVIAQKDKIVPTKNQELLFQTFGSPTHVKRMKTGHAGALMRAHLFHLNNYSDFTNDRMVDSKQSNYD